MQRGLAAASGATLVLLAIAAGWWVLRGGATAGPAAEETHEALARLQQAIGHQLQGHDDEADRLYHEAAQLDPQLRGVAYQRAVVQFGRGEFEQSRALIAQSLERGEEVAACHNLLGVMLGRENQHELAMAEFERATQADPLDAQGYYNWSESLRNLGRPAEAEQQLRRAIQLKPNEPLYHFKRRVAVVEQGESPALAELVDETKAQLALQPPSGDWLMTAAGISLARGEFAEAGAMLAQAHRAMHPALYYAMLQDSLFRRHAAHEQIAPFYDVTITRAGEAGEPSPQSDASGENQP